MARDEVRGSLDPEKPLPWFPSGSARAPAPEAQGHVTAPSSPAPGAGPGI